MISDELLERASRQSAATVYEAAGQKGALEAAIRPMSPGLKLVGRALTVQGRPGDNLTLHAAVTLARPGDVLVADVADFTEVGHWGEILTVAALARGVAGLVINGGVRDVEANRRHGFPIYARSVCMKAPLKRIEGTINTPIVVAGVLVYPGDLVLGDEDGVTIVPAADVERVLEASDAREELEVGVISRLRAGELTPDILGFRSYLTSSKAS